MDFKIDKNRGAVGTRREGNSLVTARTSSSSEDPKAALSRKLNTESKDDLASYGEKQAATGDSLVISNIKNALSTVNEAVDEILSLKTKQLAIANEAEALPYRTAHHTQLATELSTLAQRASDVATGANAGTLIHNAPSGSPLNGATYSFSSSQGEVRETISTGRISDALSSRYGLSTSTVASTTATRIEDEFVSYRANKAQYGAAADKAEQLDPEPTKEVFTVKDNRPNTLESVEAAQRLAKSVAEKLGSAYGDEQTVSKLIESSTEGLSLDRVKNLLS